MKHSPQTTRTIKKWEQFKKLFHSQIRGKIRSRAKKLPRAENCYALTYICIRLEWIVVDGTNDVIIST